MNCPSCANEQHRVLQTRRETPSSTLRQRICKGCGHVFWTVELALPPAAVIDSCGGTRRADGYTNTTFS